MTTKKTTAPADTAQRHVEGEGDSAKRIAPKQRQRGSRLVDNPTPNIHRNQPSKAATDAAQRIIVEYALRHFSTDTTAVADTAT